MTSYFASPIADAAHTKAQRLNGIHSHAGTRTLGDRHRVVIQMGDLFHVVLLSTARQLGVEIVREA